MSDNTAILAGFTKEYILSNAARDVHVFVRPGDMPDEGSNATFEAYDADNCVFLLLHRHHWDAKPIIGETK